MSSEYFTWKWKADTLTVAAKPSKILFYSLERLYLVSNKISKIENLDCCPKLNMLELGDNKIRKVRYISFVELMRSYSILPSVKALSLSIVKVENLENLTHLTELYLGITIDQEKFNEFFYTRKEQDHQNGGDGNAVGSKDTQYPGFAFGFFFVEDGRINLIARATFQ